MATTQELLDLVEARLVAFYGAGGVLEWTEGGQSFKITSDESLLKSRERLQSRLAAEQNSGGLSLFAKVIE